MSRLQDFGRDPLKFIELLDESDVRVNRDGYIPTSVRIEQYLQAGRDLWDYRVSLAEELQDADMAEDSEVDPLRAPGFDPAMIPALEERALRRFRDKLKMRQNPAPDSDPDEPPSQNGGVAPEPPVKRPKAKNAVKGEDVADDASQAP